MVFRNSMPSRFIATLRGLNGNPSQLLLFRCDRRRGFGILSDNRKSAEVEMLHPERSRSPSSALNFAHYDFIGFDLDHTLSTYNLKNLFTNHFQYMVKVLNGQGYRIDTEMTPAVVDFISRGLVIDIEKGNLLKVTSKGEIVRASHGTRALELAEISKIYGSKRQWKPLKEVMATKFATWKSRSEEMYSFTDFTDAAITAVYALAIDSGREPRTVFNDVLDALRAMYSDSHWASGVFKNAALYLNKTPEKVLQWMSAVRSHAKIALITSNWYEFVPRIAAYTLGPNWESLFDFCVYNSKKPHFFSERSNFLDLEGKEVQFNMSGNYTRGSIHIITEALTRELKRAPNCVYIGDSPLHDFVFTDIDYISIVEEVRAEGLMGGDHPSAHFISSTFWGSYLYEGDKLTLFGKLSLDGKFCAPSLEYFADQPIDHNFVKVLPRHPSSSGSNS